MERKNKYLLVAILIFILILGFFIFLNLSQSSNLGSDNTGYIIKNNYSHYSNPQVKVAIISGMHPREKLSSFILPETLKLYAVFNNVEIVNYKVEVTDRPDDFYISRKNGENLVNKYVVADIKNSNYNFVIIGHDHEPGYGEGFYIATPSMDEPSLALAENVVNQLPNFKHYKKSKTKKAKSSSIIVVDNPIVATGTSLLVYEIPEWENGIIAFIETYSLINAGVNYYE